MWQLMPITRVDKDLEANPMTVVADYDAPVERVSQVCAGPPPVAADTLI